MKTKNDLVILTVISVIGVALSMSAYFVDKGESSIFYWGILPGLPFICISLLAGVYLTPSKGSIVGATLGAIIVTLLVYGGLFYDSAIRTGAGANIGLGLLFLPLPLYYAISTWLGWKIGGNYCSANNNV